MARTTRHRSLAALGAALVATLALAAAPALAGGVAVVVPHEGDGRAVRAGGPSTLEFTVLVHGRTPLVGEAVSVVLTDSASGATRAFEARPSGKAGMFAADVAYPWGGWWTWHVEVTGLAIESAPTVVGVLGADGSIPHYAPAGALPRSAAGPAPAAGSDKLAETLAGELAEANRLLEAALAERKALADQVARLEAAAPPAVPLPLVVGLVVLAIAAAALVGARLLAAARPVVALDTPADHVPSATR